MEGKPAKQKTAAVSQVSEPPKAPPKVTEQPIQTPKPKPVQVAKTESPPPESRQVSIERRAQSNQSSSLADFPYERAAARPQEKKQALAVPVDAPVKRLPIASDPIPRSPEQPKSDSRPQKSGPAAQTTPKMFGSQQASRPKTNSLEPSQQRAPVRFAAVTPPPDRPVIPRNVLAPSGPVRSAPKPLMSPTIERMNTPQRVEIQIQPMVERPLAISEVFSQVERQAESACGSVLGGMPATHPEWLKCIGAEVEYRVYRSGNPKLVSFFESLLTFNR